MTMSLASAFLSFKQTGMFVLLGAVSGYLVNIGFVHAILGFYDQHLMGGHGLNQDNTLYNAVPALACGVVALTGFLSTSWDRIRLFLATYIVAVIAMNLLLVRDELASALIGTLYAFPFFLGGLLLGLIVQLSMTLHAKRRIQKDVV